VSSTVLHLLHRHFILELNPCRHENFLITKDNISSTVNSNNIIKRQWRRYQSGIPNFRILDPCILGCCGIGKFQYIDIENNISKISTISKVCKLAKLQNVV
jgi:hypothetical protein